MAETGEQVTGTKDENYDVISVLYHCLQAASSVDQYIQDADQSGDRELVDFFRDYQESQRDLAERAKNLLAARLMRTGRVQTRKSQKAAGGRKGGRKPVVDAGQGISPEQLGAQTNAQVNSGGPEFEDLVDEESMESFPASDPPGRY
ncbi:hypothetical protein [Vitiosangium sp. GDMCC 1.1324]|uniref:hypothetical protein n=1 Tax=Vitiosangium sp. (strain GDMCC 1.1324) TaxID=2138576 RepID=UPI000D3DAABB|nr:hypothetical protein [Vitiosangium sp. GDMCC 1.1324]PTL82571.1 hypothetical protein DAT35_17370 [Vitiosangium sp. GDMCC 1.1324]